MPPSPQTAKLTSTLHLLIPRLRLLQKKSSAQSVHQRRELSALLAEGRDESARIRVENVIATDTAVEVMEMVELYCELVLARANLLDQVAFSERGVAMRGEVRGYFVEQQQQQQRGSGKTTGGDNRGGVEKKKKESGLFSFAFWRASPSSSPSSPPPSSFSSSTPAQQSASPTDQSQPQQPESKPQDPTEEGNEEEPPKEYISPPLDTATASIIYAQARFPTEVRELTLLRALLTERYGKEFAALAADDRVPGVRVPAKLVKALRVRAPSDELVDSYLGEIARAYDVRSERYNPGGGGHQSSEGGLGGDSGDMAGKGDDGNGEGNGGGSGGGNGHGNGHGNGNTADKLNSPGGKIPEVDDLTKRFAALRR